MSLKHSLSAVDLKARYDRQSKLLLAYKPVLARILRECVKEFKGKSLPDIIHAIDHDMSIGSVPVNPGLTNRAVSLSQKNYFPDEGTVYFNLLFSATATGSVPIRVRINIETHNDYYPGYDSIVRGIFYCARLLSSQAETVFSLADQEYDRLEKVYSIWIFMNSSKEDSDSITSYRMDQKKLYGNFRGKARFDLLEVIAICLNPDPDRSHNGLIRILSTLFTDRQKAKEKIQKLKDYGIPVNPEYRKEIDNMCNLSEGVHQNGVREGEIRGEAKGEKKGIRKAGIETAVNLLKDTSMSNDQISRMVSNNVTPEEVEKLRHGEKLI